MSLEWLLSGDDQTSGSAKPKWHQNPGRSPDILRELGRKRREAEAAATENVTPLEISDIKIPLISWVQAGNLAEVIDIYQAGQADDWVTPIHSKPGKSVFALRVEGDSMTGGSNGVDFPHGCVILVDPDRAPKSGDYVVAKDVTTQKATFKKLTTDGVSRFLMPLNPAYPTREIDDPALRVIGVVIEWQLGGKL